MRNLILALFFAVCGLTVSTASNVINVSSDLNIENAFIVKLDYKEATDISIRIVSENGNEISNKKFKDVTTFIKRYKMVDVVDGDYKLIVTSNNNTTIQSLKVENSKVIVSENTAEYFKPSISIEDNYLQFNMLSLSDKSLNFQIVTMEGESIYTDKFEDKISINKIYRLNELPRGNYFIIINNADVDYRYSFKK